MSDIPSELHLEILKLIPVDHLFPLRLVCKEWRSIIDGFVSPASLLIREDTPNRGKSKIYCLDPSCIRTKKRNDGIISLTNVKNVIRSGVPLVTQFPLPTCHGLILIPSKYSTKDWALWSPFNGSALDGSSVHSIPGSKLISTRSCFFGLGYDASTSDYKVVAEKWCHGHGYKTWIYSLKSQTWRRIQDFPHADGRGCFYAHKGGVFMQGALHWIADVSGKGHCIVALDLSSESYRMIPLPAIRSWIKYLDVLGGNLFLSCNDSDGKSVWILKDYGVQNKWTKLASSKPEPVEIEWYEKPMRPVAYLKNKEQVILHYDRNKLMWLDVEKEEFVKRVIVKGFGERGFSCQHMPARLTQLGETIRAADESITLSRRTMMVSKGKRVGTEFKIYVRKRPKRWTS